MRFAPVLLPLLLTACQFPFGGTAAVSTFPPSVDIAANPPPQPAPPPPAPDPEDVVEARADVVDEEMDAITACLRFPTQAMQCRCLRENGFTDEVYRESGCPVRTTPPPAPPNGVSPDVRDGAGASCPPAKDCAAAEDCCRRYGRTRDENNKLRSAIESCIPTSKSGASGDTQRDQTPYWSVPCPSESLAAFQDIWGDD